MLFSLKNTPLSLFLGFLMLIPTLIIADADGHDHHAPQTAPFKVTTLSAQITVLQGKGGNIAIFTGKDGILMIDDGFKDMSDALKIEIEPYGGSNALTYIINTHWHGDHTEGNLLLGKTSQVAIVAHDNVRTRLLTKQEIKLFNMVSEPYPSFALPSITYKKGLTLHINDEEIEIVHYANGHTDGDSIVYFKTANIVHMGDHYFSGFFPFVDTNTGGNVVNLAENIKAVLDRIDDDTTVIPGHGPLSTKSELMAYYDMIIGTTAEVRKMKDRGKSLKKIQKKGLSKQWSEWTDGFLSIDNWIEIIYNSL